MGVRSQRALDTGLRSLGLSLVMRRHFEERSNTDKR